jgi:release factor glutamine methyltransferase
VIDSQVALAELVASGAARLHLAGIDHPSREAWWIWENVSGQSRAEQVIRGPEPVANRLALAFGARVDRRAAGEPLAHVLHEAAFRHLLVRSDARALIPRPETEGLVDLALERRTTGVIADIGTGTGCIALSLASEGNYEVVVAVEASPDALSLARLNVRRMKSPVAVVQGNLCDMIGTGQLDILISNPPYLTDAEYDSLTDSVKAWEPAEALRSGIDGLETTRRLLVEGLRVMKPGGWIILEVDCSRATRVATAAAQVGWSEVLVKDDLFGRARYLVARRSGF